MLKVSEFVQTAERYRFEFGDFFYYVLHICKSYVLFPNYKYCESRIFGERKNWDKSKNPNLGHKCVQTYLMSEQIELVSEMQIYVIGNLQIYSYH